ncbi:MAG: PD40 domain-containing protein [Bacteroidaceae bacterium]|nr:PD40 domain-containing protein [Bacteroidaceae bacterium]
MKHLFQYILMLPLWALVACSTQVPGQYATVDELPVIFPEYTNVTVPCNIAPLTFRIENEADEYVTSLKAGNKTLVFGGDEVIPSTEEWNELLALAKGDSIKVDVFAKKDGAWEKFRSFAFIVSSDEIDPYISYRLIPPSYVAYEKLTINQRALSSYDEDVIFSNMLVNAEPNGQCINCHAYKNYKTDNMQFHVRQAMGGTVFVHNGDVKKVNLKSDSTISAGVYPAFNPKYDLVAYSVNTTGQVFHTKHPNKVEVQDTLSDIIVYDPVAETVTKIAADPNALEVFPNWSPDGKTLYYCVANVKCDDPSKTRVHQLVEDYKDIKYDVVRRSWDPETGLFGSVDTVFLATALGKSATFPRVSPCGRYLLFALGEYGCFHIWHKDADLYLLNLEDGSYWPLEKANSSFAESYHAWSSNGHWILFASRRKENNYSRLYMAHINADGSSDKAFVLPQKSPGFYDFFDRSYNVPEFMVEPVSITPQEFVEVVKGQSVSVKYSPTVK